MARESIDAISPVHTLDVSVQVRDLRKLRNGWLDGDGIAPSEEGLDWFEEKFKKEFPDQLPRPRLYPTPEGGVRAEWTIGRFDASLDIDIDAHSGFWHVLQLDTGEDDARDLSLDVDTEWAWLNDQLGKLLRVAK
ncbi:hypothetical protein K8I61_03715 [bacterium]|nr:hypothetical protein [bacterium]